MTAGPGSSGICRKNVVRARTAGGSAKDMLGTITAWQMSIQPKPVNSFSNGTTIDTGGNIEGATRAAGGDEGPAGGEHVRTPRRTGDPALHCVSWSYMTLR